MTLQGERVEPRGGMDGGYWDPSTSRLAAVKTRDDNRAKLVELEAEQKEINQTTTEIEQSVTKILGEIRILEEQHSDLKILQNDCRSKIKTLMMSVKDAERAIQRQSGDLKAMRDRHGDLDAEIRTMQEELGTELQDELSDQDLAKLKQLKQDIAQLNQKVCACMLRRLGSIGHNTAPSCFVVRRVITPKQLSKPFHHLT